MREDFDKDPSKPNPYEELRVCKLGVVYSIWIKFNRHTDVTLSKLKCVLAAEEAMKFSEGQKPPHDVTPSGFFHMAIDIKERQ